MAKKPAFLFDTRSKATARAIGRLLDTYATERQRFALGVPKASARRIEACDLALDSRKPRSPRAMAATTGGAITIYDRALKLPRANLVALIRHELAHVALWGQRHTEREADELAELVSGQPIRYDACDVQTTGKGRRPRPRGLR